MKIDDRRKAIRKKVEYSALENGTVFTMDDSEHLYMVMPQFKIRVGLGDFGPPCNVWNLSANAGTNIPVDKKVIPLDAMLVVAHLSEEPA